MEPNGIPAQTGLTLVRPLPERQENKPSLFQIEDPEAFIGKAAAIAAVLAKVLKHRNLTLEIQGREHVRVEGWQLLARMLGITPVCVWTRPLKSEDGKVLGWEGRVEARDPNGMTVGAAEASCDRQERTWSNRDEHALRSMAQTRATAKALRQATGAIMALTGFEGTPVEEMPELNEGHTPIRPPVSKSSRPEGKPVPEQPQEASAPKAVTPAPATISTPQVRRLWALGMAGKKSSEQIRKALEAHGWTKPEEITRGKAYSDICTWIQSPATNDYIKEATR